MTRDVVLANFYRIWIPILANFIRMRRIRQTSKLLFRENLNANCSKGKSLNRLQEELQKLIYLDDP